jgi:hypothetical protein
MPPGTPSPIKRRGRPLGSKNAPKAKASLKESLTNVMAKEDLDYLLGTLDGSEHPDLRRDIEVLLALQMKALLPQLAAEIQSGQLTREATQRSSTVKELLALRYQMEKRETDDGKLDQRTFIQNIFLSRGFDPERLGLLLGAGDAGSVVEGESSPVLGTPDDDSGPADEVGDVPSELPSGQEQVPSGGEE